MLLYWGMFTAGFTIGAIFSFITFAAKKPEEEAEYTQSFDQSPQPQIPIIDLTKKKNNIYPTLFTSRNLNKSTKPNPNLVN